VLKIIASAYQGALDPNLFPLDRGIDFRIGGRLQAQDQFGKWYHLEPTYVPSVPTHLLTSLYLTMIKFLKIPTTVLCRQLIFLNLSM